MSFGTAEQRLEPGPSPVSPPRAGLGGVHSGGVSRVLAMVYTNSEFPRAFWSSVYFRNFCRGSGAGGIRAVFADFLGVAESRSFGVE